MQLYPEKYIFKFIKTKHVKDIYNTLRSFESLKTKLGIEYIKLCRQQYLVPTFLIIRLSIQTKNNRLKDHIARIIMEPELERKHHRKKQLRKGIKSLSIQLKMSLSLMVYSVLLNRINIAFKS